MEPKTQVIYLGRRKLLSIQRKRDAVELLAMAAIWIPTLLFIAEAGWSGLTDGTLFWSNINRLTALLATSLLVVHIALIARIPWIEAVLGLDKLTVAHKKLGKPILYLLLIHFVAAGMSYAAVDSISPLDALVYLNLNFWSVALATIALLLFVIVVFSSIRIARKKLSYESWYLIHLLSYGGIFASIPHQYELGSDFLAQPLLQTYFTLIYVFVGMNLVWFRFLQPIALSFSSQLRVVRVQPEANRTTSISIGGKGIHKFGAEAGQFFLLRVLTPKQWWRPHPFSVSNDPVDEIRFTIGNRGDDTAQLQDIKPGTKVILEGPFGVFSESKRSRQYVTLMAAGIGVAPIRALAESLAAEPGDITVIYRVTDDSDAALLGELQRICDDRGHELKLIRGPRPKGDSFLPAQADNERPVPDYARLVELAPQIVDSDVYICGPAGWSRSVKGALKKLGMDKNHVHLEEFAW
jgi:predicted ferric reductase